MCIEGSVGAGGRNAFADVIAIKQLLNLNRDRLPGVMPLKLDGRVDSALLEAIGRFQREVGGSRNPDRRVDPNGRTLRLLHEEVPQGLSKDKLRAIMPAASSAAIDKYYEPLMGAMAAHGIDTPMRQAHFLAQVAHESGSFRYSEELASGDAYEGREDLGNCEGGDGPRFKGRGLIQLTGRANYRSYGESIGVDLCAEENRRSVGDDPARAADVSGWFWESRKLNDVADRDDVREVTRRINGGYNGLAERQAFLRRAKFFLHA